MVQETEYPLAVIAVHRIPHIIYRSIIQPATFSIIEILVTAVDKSMKWTR
jgi:hypothetical protein